MDTLVADTRLWLYMVAVVALVLVIWLCYDAANQTPFPLKRKPQRMLSCDVETDVRDTLAIVLRFAREQGYCLEAFDEGWNRMALSDTACGLRSWGFFYFIYVTAAAPNGSRIEVGIRSRLTQVGTEVRRRHERFVCGIKAAVFLHQTVHNSVENPYDLVEKMRVGHEKG